MVLGFSAMHGGSICAALAVTLIGACSGGSASSGESTTTVGTPDTVDTTPDRCPLLLRCWEHVDEFKRCPEPVIRFKPNSTELDADSQTTIASLATEIKQIGRLKKLLIEGHHAPDEAKSLAESRALSIQTRLVDKGVHDDLLEIHTERVKGGSHEVTLHVIDCSKEKAVKRTQGKSKAFWIILY